MLYISQRAWPRLFGPASSSASPSAQFCFAPHFLRQVIISDKNTAFQNSNLASASRKPNLTHSGTEKRNKVVKETEMEKRNSHLLTTKYMPFNYSLCRKIWVKFLTFTRKINECIILILILHIKKQTQKDFATVLKLYK